MSKKAYEEIVYTDEDFEVKISKAIEDRKSFVVYGVSGNMKRAVSLLERFVEERKFSCRIYTLNRAAAAVGITWTVAGSATWLAIASHNLLTFNPDYEIGRDLFNNKIFVKYKKAKRDERLRKKEMQKKSM